MLQCYLDDSGTDGVSPIITLAGYLARSNSWEQFEKQSAVLFKKKSLKYYHSKKFYDGKKPFKNWDRKKKDKFIKDWFDISNMQVLRGITMSLPSEVYNKRREEFDVNHNVSPLGQCFTQLLIQLSKDNAIWYLMKSVGLEIFVEAGNKNNAGILEWFNKKRESNDELGQILKSLSFADKQSCHAIQLADFLAFFSRRYAVDNFVNGADEEQMHPYLILARHRVTTLGFGIYDFTKS